MRGIMSLNHEPIVFWRTKACFLLLFMTRRISSKSSIPLVVLPDPTQQRIKMFLVVISLILLATQLANSAAVLPRQAGETVVTVTQVVTVPVATPTKTSFYTVFETVTASQSALSAGLLPVTQISNGQLQVPPPATIQSVQSVNSNSKSIVDSPTIVVSASRVGFSGIHYSASSIVTPSSLPFPKYTWKPSTQSSNRSYCKASKATLAPSIPMASNSTASKPATGTPAASKPATSNSASSKPAANNPLAYSRLTLSHGSSLGSAMLPPSSAPVKPPVSTQSSDFFTILYPSNTNPAASMASSSKQPTSPKPTPAHSSSSSHSTAIVVIPVTGSALAELKSKINIPAASVTAHHPRDFRRADKSDAVNPLLSKLFTNGPQIVPTINLQPVTIVSTKPPSTIFECGLPIATSPGSVVTYLSTPSGHVEHPPTAPAKVSYTFSLGPTTSSTPPPPPPPKSTPPPPPPPPPPSSSKYVPPRTLTHIVGERRAEPSPAVGAFTGLHYSAEPIITPSANHKNAERVREGLVVDENPSPSIPVVTRIPHIVLV
ncbi:hypothetical protein BU16DRAFT_261838 [Lophium mytilinum]|uniref:Uncharacterized protein n=1 Tax=Lophium mytilinum TaxID=390894 RepID=A0A6A6R349_9PEZI|nr:hypothetical protein BU16DRAFT_261838 [Lophium mytilinum]